MTRVPCWLLLADDFVMTVAEGTTYNKAQIVASVADNSYRPEALQSTGLVVHSYGNTAVVTGNYYEKGVDKGKPWERPRAFYRHLDESGREVAMYREPFQCQAEIVSKTLDCLKMRCRPNSFLRSNAVSWWRRCFMRWARYSAFSATI